MSVSTRIPVVAGLAYIEHVRRQPASFQATLAVEPDHRYFRHAIAVRAGEEKLGYVAPEVAWGYFEAVRDAEGPITCRARRALPSDQQTSGVELLLDFSGLKSSA